MRVSAAQYHLHTISTFDAFARQVEHYIRTAAEFEVEFLLFPEFITTQLMSIGTNEREALTIDELPGFTEAYLELFTRLAKQYGMYLIGGTHVIERKGKLYNMAHLFRPDGTVEEQAKLHITPTEVTEWNMAAGDGVRVFPTEKGHHRHSYLL